MCSSEEHLHNYDSICERVVNRRVVNSWGMRLGSRSMQYFVCFFMYDFIFTPCIRGAKNSLNTFRKETLGPIYISSVSKN